jgi:hypothetical protein
MPYPGQPADTPIPSKLDKWNWGAFLLNWIWGLGNSTFIALLMFVPLVNLVMVFLLGAKGSKWAWKNRIWADEEHFVRTQRNWARAGFVVFIAGILLVVGLVYSIFGLMKNSDAYKMSVSRVILDPQVVEVMGEPITPGWFVTGSIELKNNGGKAKFSIPLSGPKCSGRAVSRAVKTGEVWDVYLLVVRFDCQKPPVVLINKRNIPVGGAGVET